MSQVERNDEICRLYIEGASIYDIGPQFKLSHERVRQILRQRGILREDRALSDRDEFLGVNISEQDKDALRAEAARRGLSMSALTADLIRDMLSSLQNDTQETP